MTRDEGGWTQKKGREWHPALFCAGPFLATAWIYIIYASVRVWNITITTARINDVTAAIAHCAILTFLLFLIFFGFLFHHVHSFLPEPSSSIKIKSFRDFLEKTSVDQGIRSHIHILSRIFSQSVWKEPEQPAERSKRCSTYAIYYISLSTISKIASLYSPLHALQILRGCSMSYLARRRLGARPLHPPQWSATEDGKAAAPRAEAKRRCLSPGSSEIALPCLIYQYSNTRPSGCHYRLEMWLQTRNWWLLVDKVNKICLGSDERPNHRGKRNGRVVL